MLHLSSLYTVVCTFDCSAVCSSAKEFQSAVPGMTARQAAILKRFLASGGASGGGAVSGPTTTGSSAVGEGPAARYGALSTSQRGRH